MESHLEIFPWLGGWFVFMWMFAAYFAYLLMPWVTYLSIIIKVFRVDPGKGQIPRDPLAVEKASPKKLLAMAQRRLKERTPLTKGKCDLWLLNSEALIK
jgi:hypothetical protein